jgi:hypothetical protein
MSDNHDPAAPEWEENPFRTGARVEVHPLGDWGYLVSLADDEDDGYDEDEVHNARHPWWFAGCADCDERADRREAEQ